MENTTQQMLNPWVSIWTRPRATIQQIVDVNPQRYIWALAAVSGVADALNQASERSAGDELGLPLILLIVVAAGSIGGIVSLYLFGALFRWTGGWMGGKASAENLRAAIAWSSVPVICSLVLWIPSFAIFGQELFTTETPNIDVNPSLLFVLFGYGAIEMIIGVWAFVVLLKCIGQVQGFSAWKALGNTLLVGLIVMIPIALIIYGIGGFPETEELIFTTDSDAIWL
jgi:hypothetical protein